MPTKEFVDKYGNPDVNGDGILDPDWFAHNIKVFKAPFPMVVSWKPDKTTQAFQAHRLAGDRIAAALSRVVARCGLEYLREKQLDRWGGCFNFRLARGRDELSMHSWGTAVDYCPDKGRLGNAADAATYPRFVVEAFEAEGFVWGGRWKRPDAMHFVLED